MHILHILGPDITFSARAGFLDLAAILGTQGIEQQVILHHDPYLEAAMERTGVRTQRARFSGLFDLQTPRLVQHTVQESKPDIILSWTQTSSRFVPGCIFLPPLFGYMGNQPVIPPPVILNETPEPLDRADVQTPANAFVIGTLCRINADRNLGPIIQATASYPNIHFWIAGEGASLAPLQRLASVCGASERIHFLGFQTSRAGFLKSLDACIVPPRTEGCERLILESWAAGVPVIACLEDGQFPPEGRDACLDARPGTVQAWKESIDKITQDSQGRERLVKRGSDLFAQNYGPLLTTERFLNFIRQIQKG